MSITSVVGDLSDSDGDIPMETKAPAKKPAAKWETQAQQVQSVTFSTDCHFNHFCFVRYHC